MVNVYFTVDTESSMAGALVDENRRPLEASKRVFCRIGDEDFGVPLLVNMMRPYGFRGTYFVETLSTSCLGQADMRSVFDYLLGAGQDVQLHIHPVFWFYSERQRERAKGREYSLPKPTDLIGQFGRDAQRDLLSRAVGYFEEFAGYRPTAFRAGCYAGSRAMMESLNEMGVRVDSSWNPCFHPQTSFPEGALTPNLVQQISGVWEIPVTVARSKLREGYGGFKFADPSALSFPEIRSMLDATANAGNLGLQHFVIVFHSFSAVKAKDVAYSEMRPNRIVIDRLKQTFQYLAENPRKFRVETMGNVAKNLAVLEATSPVVMPDLGLISSAVRKAVQAINNAYRL